jgi:hypothetical protein
VPDSIEQILVERISGPGWVATRGVLGDPAGDLGPEHYEKVEAVMKTLAAEGKVVLWWLTIESGQVRLLAAARPGFQLDKELSERGAWASAQLYQDA